MRLAVLAIVLYRLIGLARSEQVALLSPHGYEEAELSRLHQQMVEIQSISGDEHAIGEFLHSYLKTHNYSVELQRVGHRRFNVLAYRGSERNTKILLTSHIDTVPPFIPYSFRESDETIWGRGTVDAKACVAAQIVAVNSVFHYDQLSPGSVSLLFVVGEETGGDGMVAANDLGLSWETVIFGEPTEGKLVSGHKGFLGMKISVTGKAAHSGYPWLGLSATSVLLEALEAIIKLEKRLPSSEKYGNTTINIGKIDGGVAANVVAERASAGISLRLAAGTPTEVKKMLLDSLESISSKAKEAGGQFDIEWAQEAYAPVDINHDVAGFDVGTVNYGTDIPHLHGSHKRYLYGPGSILVAHSKEEHLKMSELNGAVEDYRKLILASLGLHYHR